MADRDLFLKLDKEVLIKFCRLKKINTGTCFAKVDFVNVIIEKGYEYSDYSGKKKSKKLHLGLHDKDIFNTTNVKTMPTKLKKTATRFMLDADIDEEGDLDVAEFILAAKYLGSEVDNDELMETYLEHMENGGYENKTKPKQIIKDLMQKLDEKYHHEDYLDDAVIKSQETSIYAVNTHDDDDIYVEDVDYANDGTDIDIFLADQRKEQQLEIARNLMNISILNRYEIAEMTGCNADDLKQFESDSDDESEYESDSEDDTETNIKDTMLFDGVKVVGNKNNSIIIKEEQCKQLEALIDGGIDGINSNIEDTVTLLKILNDAIHLAPGAMKRAKTMKKLNLSAKNVQNVQSENVFPIKYRVVINPGALCKSRMDRKHPESKRIAELMQGTDVLVEEIVGNRARISSPNEGWISLKSSKSNTPIIERIDAKNQSKAMADALKASKMRKTQLEIIKSVTTLSEKTCLHILEKSHWNTRVALDSFFSAKFMTQKYAKNDDKKAKKGWFKSWTSFAKSGNVNDKMIKKALKVIKRGKKDNMKKDEIESFLAEKGFTESDIAHAYAEYNKLNSVSSKDDASN